MLLVALCGTAAPAVAEKVRVEVVGIDGELEDNVMSVLGIAELGDVDKGGEAAVRRRHADAEKEIAFALEPFGYYRPEIRSELTREGGTWTARYEIRPGPPLRLHEVVLEIVGEGAERPLFRQLLRRFPLQEGDVVRHPIYDQAKADWGVTALNDGYLDARFLESRIAVDREAYRAAIHLRFDTGPRFYFGGVRFEQDILDADFLRGYVTFEIGDPLEFDRLLVLQNSLGESPYFRSVEVRPVREEADAQNRVPIVVRMTPQKRLRLDVGAGFGTDTGPQANAEPTWRRVNRAGHLAGAELRFSQIEKSASLRYEIPWPYPRTDRLALSAGWGDFDTETSNSETWRAGAKYTWSRGAWQHLLSLFYQREHFVVGADEGTKKLLVPEASASITRADDRLDTRRGFRLRAATRGATDAVLSDVSFAQLEGSAKGVITAARRHRFLARIEAGWTDVSSFRDLPPSFRFFAGGAQSVRGYPFRSLGPRDESGAVAGGEKLLVASAEYEFRLFKRWGVAAFYDVGNAFNKFEEPLASGVGVGLRWVSPVGIVRGDVAAPLDDDDTKVRFHLAIGPDL